MLTLLFKGIRTLKSWLKSARRIGKISPIWSKFLTFIEKKDKKCKEEKWGENKKGIRAYKQTHTHTHTHTH